MYIFNVKYVLCLAGSLHIVLLEIKILDLTTNSENKMNIKPGKYIIVFCRQI